METSENPFFESDRISPCASCDSACCKSPLALENRKLMGHIRKSHFEIDLGMWRRDLSSRINDYQSSFKHRISVKGIDLKTVIDANLLTVSYRVAFTCSDLSAEGYCENYRNRPNICRDFACFEVNGDSHYPSKDYFQKRNAEMEKTNWDLLPKAVREAAAEVRFAAAQAWGDF